MLVVIVGEMTVKVGASVWPVASLEKPKDDGMVRWQMGTVSIIVSVMTELVPQLDSILNYIYAI